jgi:uncharacterized membrane protein
MASEGKVDIWASIGQSWECYKANFGISIGGFVVAMLVLFVINLGAGLFQGGLAYIFRVAEKGDADTAFTAGAVMVLVFYILLRVVIVFVSWWIEAGLKLFFVNLFGSMPASIGDVFILDFHKIGNIFIAQILMMLGIIAGFICLIVPGIILMLMWSQTLFFIVERNMSALEAMKASATCMKGYKLDYLVIFIVIGIAMGLITVFTCGIGWIFTMPYMLILQAYVYKLLSGEAFPGLKESDGDAAIS